MLRAYLYGKHRAKKIAAEPAHKCKTRGDFVHQPAAYQTTKNCAHGEQTHCPSGVRCIDPALSKMKYPMSDEKEIRKLAGQAADNNQPIGPRFVGLRCRPD